MQFTEALRDGQDDTMPRIGIPYNRFSGKRQEAGDSLRRQETMAEQAAKEEGVVLDRSITLSDKGISAFRGLNWKKGDLGKFLDLVDAKVIPKGSVLIIEQVNRLSRMPWMEQVQLWKEILGRGIIIRTCVPPSRYTKENMNELSIGCPVVLLMMLAHQESVQKSEWVRQAWGEKKRKAAAENQPHGQACPAWILPLTEKHPKDPARQRTVGYDLHPDKAGIVQQMFQWAAEGDGAIHNGAFRIWNRLRAEGVPAIGKKKHWSLSYVKKILSGREAIGEYQPAGRDPQGRRILLGPPIPGYYPAVVSEELFNQVQIRRRQNRKKGGRSGHSEANLFTGLVYHAHDGALMHCTPKVQQGRRYQYLRSATGSESIAYLRFEEAILELLARLKPRDFDGRLQAKDDPRAARVDRLQEECTRLVLELQTLDQQIRELPPAKWPKRVVARMSELETLIQEKEDALERAKETADVTGRSVAFTEVKTSLQYLDELREKGNPAELREARRRIKSRLPFLIESIWIRVQAPHKRGRYIHVRVYLRGGEERYLCIPHGVRLKEKALPLDSADFRGGAERGYAPQPCLRTQPRRKLSTV